MSSGYGKKSPKELKVQLIEQTDTAEETVPCVAVTETNWAAMIGLQRTQNEALSEIMERQMKLATQAELGRLLTQQTESLTQYLKNCEGMTQEYTEQMKKNIATFTTQMNTAMSDISSQAGKMSEQFSKAISSAQEKMNRRMRKAFWISLTPTAVLIIWELIRHIFLLT